MSDPADRPVLDACGCCEGARPDEPVRNAPALPALRYRIGTHARFLERMQQAIPQVLGAPGGPRPLQALTARTTDDPTIALLDAAAVVADILSFYQERIANEGFLRTAVERRSVLELARTIGYELSPGVAASAHLAFTMEEAPGAPAESLVPKGTQVQSVPPQDKLPQVFETSAAFVARPEWNVLRPRLARPAEMAVIQTGGSTGPRALHLLGAAGTFPPATDGLVTGLNPNDVHRLDSTESSAPVMDAIPVTRIYLTEDAAGIAKGDVLLFVGSRANDIETLALRAAGVAEEFERGPGGDIKRVRIDLEALPTAASPDTQLTGEKVFQYRPAAFPPRATVRLATLPFTSATLAGAITTNAWLESDVQALLGIQRWPGRSFMRALNRRSPGEPVKPEAGAFAFRETVGFFGNTAPRWSSLPAENTKGNPYTSPWDAGDIVSSSPDTSASIWTDSQGRPNTNAGADVFLERPVKGITGRTWVVFETSDELRAYAVHDGRDVSRADFGISGRAMALSLRTPDGTSLTSSDRPTEFTFRATTARVASRRLQFAELPIKTPLAEGLTEIELDRAILGLTVGQPIAISGERDDLRGVDVAEIATLKEIVHTARRTTLVLESGLRYTYVRDSVAICANVVHATHGETITEVLGSGDGSVPNARLPLKKPPLTHLSAPTPRGVASTLEVLVNRVRWEESSSLYHAGPHEEVYVVRIDDDARAEVIFGDGERGARLPSGSANVTATYRSGIGVDGEVDARALTVLRTIPLGIRGVANPVAAGGAESPERLANARQNAPLTVVTFERIVSLADYEDFARTFPGIGKALADRLWVEGRDLVHLTVAGATGGAPGPDVLKNLVDAIAAATDRSQRVEVAVFALRYFTVHARLLFDPRRIAADVLGAALEKLRDSFSFDRRELGQSVTPSEVIARVHEVEGVLGADLETLAEYSEDAAPASSTGQPVEPVVSHRARRDPDMEGFQPAELLLINPVGITVEEMPR
jgi:hypothetical protein